MKYKTGDRVAIVRGTYAHHKYGTFICKSGSAMCYVKVDNDLRHERRIWLSSIAALKETNHDSDGANHDGDDDATEEILAQLLEGLNNIRLATNALEKKIKTKQQQPRRREST